MPTIVGIFIIFVKFSLSFFFIPLLLIFLATIWSDLFCRLSPPPIWMLELWNLAIIQLTYWTLIFLLFESRPLGDRAPRGHQSQKRGHFSSFTSICIPEVSFNRRAPKPSRNFTSIDYLKISNVFFRTRGRARSASRNAKTRYWLLLRQYLR